MRKIVGVLLLAGMAACIREPELAELVQHMIVQTEYDLTEVEDDNNVFNEYSKFVLRMDTIGLISPFTRDTLLLDDSNIDTDLPRSEFVKEVVDQVESNVIARGYNRVDELGDPDFGVKVIVIEQFSFFLAVSYPGYYTGYYGYYGGYYGPVVNTYASSFVTMVIEVVDIKNYEDNENKYKVIWSAYMGDLATSVDRNTKIIEAVNQAFDQSPYFSKG